MEINESSVMSSGRNHGKSCQIAMVTMVIVTVDEYFYHHRIISPVTWKRREEDQLFCDSLRCFSGFSLRAQLVVITLSSSMLR